MQFAGLRKSMLAICMISVCAIPRFGFRPKLRALLYTGRFDIGPIYRCAQKWNFDPDRASASYVNRNHLLRLPKTKPVSRGK